MTDGVQMALIAGGVSILGGAIVQAPAIILARSAARRAEAERQQTEKIANESRNELKGQVQQVHKLVNADRLALLKKVQRLQTRLALFTRDPNDIIEATAAEEDSDDKATITVEAAAERAADDAQYKIDHLPVKD